jgi:hypothetical protein
VPIMVACSSIVSVRSFTDVRRFTDRRKIVKSYRFWNLLTLPSRLMARYLERRGWVVFYLEPHSRSCGPQCRGFCWLREYEADKRRRVA